MGRNLNLDQLFGADGNFLNVDFDAEKLLFTVFVAGRKFELQGITDYVPQAEADNCIPIYVTNSQELYNAVLQEMRVTYPTAKIDEVDLGTAILSALNKPVIEWNSLYIVYWQS